jgi:S1-C subfamily serine protease
MFKLEAGMMLLKNGRVAAIAVFLVGFVTIPLNAQTRFYTNILPQNSKTYLGIQMEDVTAENVAKYKLNAERGVIVRSVSKGSPAEVAALHANDVILEFAGTQVWSSMQLSRLVEETPPERKVELTVSRDGKRMNLTAQLKERDNNARNDRGNRNDRGSDNGIDIFPRGLLGPNNRFFQFGTPEPQENRKPRLGVTLQPLTEQWAEYLGVEGKKGALVFSVAGNSPSSGKLNTGDVIIAADGKKIEDPEDLAQLVRDKSKGSITLKVIRNKKEITVVVNLPEEEDRDDKGYKL